MQHTNILYPLYFSTICMAICCEKWEFGRSHKPLCGFLGKVQFRLFVLDSLNSQNQIQHHYQLPQEAISPLLTLLSTVKFI